MDFRSQGRGCKVFLVDEIISTTKYERAFLVRGMRFSPSGEYIDENDVERWPGPCCLEDPDSEALGWGPQLTRRQGSERWHAIEAFGRLVADGSRLSTQQLIDMVRIADQDYKPTW